VTGDRLADCATAAVVTIAMAVDTPSTFTWLAYSASEQQRAQELASLLSERETRDELGLGSIRDAISDRLFPGTSTIQSRARYFLFLPWIFQGLEAKTGGRAQQNAEWAERKLIEHLRQSDDLRGLVGTRSHLVLRLPSSIYWAGLGVLGVRRSQGPLSLYYRWLDDPERHRHHARDDDHDLIVGAATTWWDCVPAVPDGFPERASFALTAEEAQYLADRAVAATPYPTMLGQLWTRGTTTEDVQFPWEHPQAAAMPPSVREDLAVAERFSLIAHGASILYNQLIAIARSEDETADDYRGLLDVWQEEHFAAVTTFDLERVWNLAHSSRPRAREFVRQWQQIVRQADGQLSTDTTAQAFIRSREIRVKGEQRSRIANPFRVEWSGASGASRMDYRWSVAVKQMCIDLTEGHASA
jgi:Family of unknown function (DUF6361)